MASRREETSDSEEESSFSLSDNENLAPPNKKRRGRKAQWRDCHVADRIDKLVLHFDETKWEQSTAKVELLVYAFPEDDAAYTVALSASSFAFLQKLFAK